MSVQDEYAKQRELAAWVDARLKIAFPNDRRSLITLGCFDLAIEHHAAMCILCNGQLFGSMLGLLRVGFEAYVRGVYLRYCASEKELDMFERDRLNKRFLDLIADVERAIGLEPHPLRGVQNNSWNIMNSFTHTGFQHVVRRHANGKTGPVNYSEQEVVQALNFAGVLVLLSATELASMADNEPLRQDVFAKLRSYVA
jgi:hypothetical protein